mgnify:FL=1
MARPIRNTPILFGEDATEFLRKINTPIPEAERRAGRKKVQEGAARLLELAARLPKRSAQA